MTRARDLADSADKDIAGTLTIDTLHTSGNVGIGTSSVSDPLHIKATRGIIRLEPTAVGGTTYRIRNGISGGSEGGLSFYDVTNSATRLVIDSSGNVGIGTSSPEASRRMTVDIGTTAVTSAVFKSSDTSGGSYISFMDKDTSNSNRVRIGAINDDMSFLAAGSERMRIDSSGNVGIGTTSPNARLEVEDNGATTSALLKVTADDSGPYAFVVGNDTFSTSDTDGMAIWTGNSGEGTIAARGTGALMRFRIGSSEAMRITSTRSVCVNGTTTNFGFFQVNQPTNNDENGIGIVSSAAARSMRLWVDESVSYINSGNGGGSQLHLNQGDGKITMGTHNNLEVNPNPSASLSAVYIRSGEGTNSGSSTDLRSGTQLLNIQGDSDALQIRNIHTGDYSIVNSQQGNGIAIYDGTGGLGFFYANSEKAEVTSSGFSTVSDERLKDQQGDIDVDAISVFNSLNLFKYHPKAHADDASGDTGTMMYGFSAQQLNQLAPNAVNDGVDDLSDDPKKPWYSVSDTSLKALMIQAIKTLSAENEAMKARLDALENA